MSISQQCPNVSTRPLKYNCFWYQKPKKVPKKRNLKQLYLDDIILYMFCSLQGVVAAL